KVSYSIESVASVIHDNENLFDVECTDSITVNDIFFHPVYVHSTFTFEEFDTDMLMQLFSMYENEAKSTMEKKLVFPAYDYVLKCSHTFNLLDARGVISVTERTGYISRVRHFARQIAKIYVEER